MLRASDEGFLIVIRVAHVFGQMNRGGAEMRTLELMPALIEQGVDLTFYTLSQDQGPGQLDEEILSMGGRIIGCPLTRNPFDFARRFKFALQQGQYDIVHSHIHLKSGWIVKLSHEVGVRGRVIHFRSTFAGNKQTALRALYNRKMRAYARKHANAVLAVSQAAMSFGWGPHWHHDPRAMVLYNGFNLEPFRQASADSEALLHELGLPSRSRLVVQIGRFVTPKGHRELIPELSSLFRAHPDVHVLFVGDGPFRSEIEKMIRERSLDQVHLLGVRSDVPRLLKCANVSILPSLWEGLPGVVVESIAAGTRCIAMPLPGVIEVAEHTDMVEIVESGTHKALVADMIEFLKRPGPAGSPPPFPEVFALDRCADQLMDVYRRVSGST